jgi:hypothetical protein
MPVLTFDVIRNQGALTLLLLGLPICGLGQLGPLELLPEWGQAGWSNPAIMHPSGGHLLIGGLSGGQVELDHTGPTYADFIGADGAVNPNALLSNMDPVESIGFRSETPIISLGFRDEKRFEFRLRSQVVTEQRFDYDRDLFDVAWRGNGHPDNIGRPISFGGMGANAQVYFDHGVSVGAMAKEDKLWLGWGIHLLNGVAAFQTETFDVEWTTDTLDYSWDLAGAATLNAAGLNLDSLLNQGEIEIPGNGGMPNILGSGVAFDFGFLWRLGQWVELDGSIEGMGGMRWLESLSRKRVDPANFILEGIDLVGELEDVGSSSSDSISQAVEDWAAALTDSLEATFPVESDPGLAAAFDTRIRETWRLGMRFRPSESLEVSVMAYRQFRFGQTTNGGLFGVTYRLRGNVTAHLQGQYHSSRWMWGSGLSLRGGPVRLSVSARNVPGLLLPLDAGHWQGQVGISFDMGYAQKKKRRKNDLGTGKGMWH